MTWLLCDYGQVLSLPQPADDKAALVRASGIDGERFWLAYWAHRISYDRGDLTAEAYWTAVLGAAPDAATLETLVAIDIAGWSHPNEETLAATEQAARRGYRLAILSNAPLELARALDRLRWLAPFRPRLFSCYLRGTKPDPALYRSVLERLGAPPDDVVFLDDREDNVHGALAAGLRAQIFTGPGDVDALPDPVRRDRQTPADVTIREGGLRDHARTLPVLRETFDFHQRGAPAMFRATDTPMPTREMLAEILDGGGALLLAEHGDEVVGFATLMIGNTPDVPFFQPRRRAIAEHVGVLESWRGHGVGHALMHAAEEWARRRGATQLQLNVWEFNAGAIRFYESLGYRTYNRNMLLDL